MKNINSLLIVAMLITGTSASFAASHAAAPAASGASTVSALPIAQAEIRKIDLRTKESPLSTVKSKPQHAGNDHGVCGERCKIIRRCENGR